MLLLTNIHTYLTFSETSDVFSKNYQFSSVAQSCLTLCHPMDCSMPGFPAHHQLLSLLKLMSIESVMPSNHLILCHPLLLLPSIFPSIRVFSNESVLCIRWPKHWNFSFSISPSQSITAQKSNCLPSPGQLCFPASDGLLGNEESFDFHIHTHMC